MSQTFMYKNRKVHLYFKTVQWISIIMLGFYPWHRALHVPTAVALLKNSHNKTSADLSPPLIHSVTACGVKYISNVFLLQGTLTVRETSWDSPLCKYIKYPLLENVVRILNTEHTIFGSFASREVGKLSHDLLSLLGVF